MHHWVIWPRGAEHNGDQVLLADGTAVTEGATLTGSGLLLPIADAVPSSRTATPYLPALVGGAADRVHPSDPALQLDRVTATPDVDQCITGVALDPGWSSDRIGIGL